MDESGMVVDGFAFESGQEAEKARKEAEGIEYIREKIQNKNPKMALEMYRKLVNEQVFETPVGWMFLRELQDYVLSFPELSEEPIEPIYVPSAPSGGGGGQQMEEMAAWYEESMNQERQRRRNAESSRDWTQKELGKKKGLLRICVACIAFLLIVSIGMVTITLVDDHPNILNYENKIVDKYEAWEKELEEREAALDAREKGRLDAPQ